MDFRLTREAHDRKECVHPSVRVYTESVVSGQKPRYYTAEKHSQHRCSNNDLPRDGKGQGTSASSGLRCLRLQRGWWLGRRNQGICGRGVCGRGVCSRLAALDPSKSASHEGSCGYRGWTARVLGLGRVVPGWHGGGGRLWVLVTFGDVGGGSATGGATGSGSGSCYGGGYGGRVGLLRSGWLLSGSHGGWLRRSSRGRFRGSSGRLGSSGGRLGSSCTNSRDPGPSPGLCWPRAGAGACGGVAGFGLLLASTGSAREKLQKLLELSRPDLLVAARD
ncbi:hypothetical protein LZ30DRAFT_719807 [Colletotrichum cereale]|nr:hypothetical protein LZ30DRAFT_719807 [Colletotrichum cereale]